jgi:hypothetical protein
MIPLLLTILTASTPGDRLEAFIIKRQPKARAYAGELSKRIIIESKRHGIPPHVLAAIAYIESDFNPNVNGKAGEFGAFQVMRNESGIDDAWDWLRSHPKGFALATKWGAMPWRKLGRQQVAVLRSVAEGTYIAAMAIKRHWHLCRRLGHRVGRFRCNKQFISQCPKYHPQAVDRWATWNSGVGWPKAHYLRKLRWRSRRIKRILGGK